MTNTQTRPAARPQTGPETGPETGPGSPSRQLVLARRRRALRFSLVVLAGGLLCFAWAVVRLVVDGGTVSALALLAVPVIVLVARFPLVIDEGEGGIEVGFDSSILMFLVCTYSAPVALTLWSVGVLCTQVSSTRRWSSKAFNIGVGALAGATATAVLHAVRRDHLSTSVELLAVALAAAAYFAVDYLLSAITVSLQSGEPIAPVLQQRGTLLAIGCFVPFDLLGYLGAILLRSSPAWTLLLLSVPLGTLLVATRAVTRGRENARRLQVLLDAAVDSQTMADPLQVTDALLEDARRLLRLRDLDVLPRPPGRSELGAQVRGTDDPLWLVAPARSRARASLQADKQALAALAAVSRASFARLALTDDLVHLARYDPLTDLPNRAVFLDRLHYALHLNRRRRHDVVLLFVDLDGFKPVNDRFGHAAGDAVLIEVSRRLQANVREGDIVARLGGDEFAVLFEDVQLDQVTSACERILAAVAEGVVTPDQVVHVSASIGVAPGSGVAQADELLRNADLAMYEAKAQGKHRYVVYEPAMLASRLERLELVEALEAALADDRLTMVYQPVVEAATGWIVGVESLVRWRHGTVEVSTDAFIRLAEESGLIDAVGASVLAMVTRDAVAIGAAAGGGAPIAVGVNVSPTQLRQEGFAQTIRAALEVMGGAALLLEITEREGISLDPDVLRTMDQVSELGVRFAIDDFGVGFSSISYLQQVPADIVKIDAGLVHDIDRDPKARGLLQSLSRMSQALGLDIVVEGIERESQLAVVREDVPGVFVQGFHLHRPLPLPELLEVLRTNRREVAGPALRAR